MTACDEKCQSDPNTFNVENGS